MQGNDQVVYFAAAALIVRLVGTVIFGMVLVKQIKLIRGNYRDGLNRVRKILAAVVFVPFAYNFLTMYNNIVRITEGGIQNQFLNNLTVLLGAIAATVTAIGFYIFYRGDKK